MQGPCEFSQLQPTQSHVESHTHTHTLGLDPMVLVAGRAPDYISTAARKRDEPAWRVC